MANLRSCLPKICLALVGVVALVAIAACTSSSNASSSSATTSTPPTSTSPTTRTGAAVSVDLIAQNIAFDKKTITVPAGASVTINFNNKDSGMPHNFALYTDSGAGTLVFKGDTINGPAATTYKFTAPTEPGTYFFRCDIHPTTMTGSFVVQ